MFRDVENRFNSWFGNPRRQPALTRQRFQNELESLRSRLQRVQLENIELKNGLRQLQNSLRHCEEARVRATSDAAGPPPPYTAPLLELSIAPPSLPSLRPTAAEKRLVQEDARKLRATEDRRTRWSDPLLETARAEVRLMEALDDVVTEEYRTLNKGAQILGPVPDYSCRSQGYPIGCQMNVPADPKERARFLFLATTFGEINAAEKDIVLIHSKAPSSFWKYQNAYTVPEGLTFSEDALRAAVRRSQQLRAKILSKLNVSQRAEFFARARKSLEEASEYDDFSPNLRTQVLQNEKSVIASIGGTTNIRSGGRAHSIHHTLYTPYPRHHYNS